MNENNKQYNKRYKQDNQGNPKYRLKPEEAEIINEYRRILEESKIAGIDPDSIKHGWIKSKQASLFFKNPHYKKKSTISLKKSLLKSYKNIALLFL